MFMKPGAFTPDHSLVFLSTLAIPDRFLMLRTAFSLLSMFSGSLRAECAFPPPSNNIAAILIAAMATAILLCNHTLASMSEMRNVLAGPPDASKKKNPLC